MISDYIVELDSTLSYYSKYDHSDYDSFALFNLSHASEDSSTGSSVCDSLTEKGCFLTTDMFNIDYNLVLNFFTKDRCPSLVGKPKLFLFDTCRDMRGLYTPIPSLVHLFFLLSTQMLLTLFIQTCLLFLRLHTVMLVGLGSKNLLTL